MSTSTRRWIMGLAVSAGLAAATAAATPQVRIELLKDLDDTPGAQGSEPGGFVAWNGVAYFSAKTVQTGSELFRTDGTPAGTRLAVEFAAGPLGSNARPLGAANGRLIVQADDGVVGPQLWAYAGAGTSAVRLTSLPIGPYVVYPFEELDGRLLLRDPLGDGMLFSTDGTAAGTVAIGRSAFGYRNYVFDPSCRLGNLAVFVVGDNNTEASLASTDGTVAGTQLAATVRSGYALHSEDIHALSISGQCQFLIRGPNGASWELWTSNGTAATTAPVASSTNAVPLGLYEIGGVLHIAQYAAGRFQLLRNTPGTLAFNVVVDKQANFQPPSPVKAGNGVAFVVDESPPGVVAYFYDGSGGPRRLYPAQSGQPALPSGTGTAIGGALVFQSRGQDSGLRIDIATGAVTPAPPPTRFDMATSIALGDRRVGPGLGANGIEPWVSDGTAPGTAPLADLWAETADGLPRTIGRFDVARNGDVLFFATGSSFGSDGTLWRTDGTAAATRKLPPALLQNGSVEAPQAMGDGVVFVDFDNSGNYRRSLARADSMLENVVALSPTRDAGAPLSTGDGFVFVASSPTGVNLMGSPDGGTAALLWAGYGGFVEETLSVGRVGGAAIFVGGTAHDVWRSDGTAPGTFRLAAGGARAGSGFRYPSAVMNGRLYFMNCVTDASCWLTATDGTVAGTTALREVTTSYPTQAWWQQSFAVVGQRVLFTLEGRLWVSDGTPGGTDMLLSTGSNDFSNLAVAGGLAHLAVGCYGDFCKYTYVVSDGTPAGTRYVATPAGLELRGTFAASLGDVVLFACETTATGVEPCIADADGSHVRILADVYPGATGSAPTLIGTIPNAAVIRADDGTHGFEPWIARQFGDHIFASGFDNTVERGTP